MGSPRIPDHLIERLKQPVSCCTMWLLYDLIKKYMGSAFLTAHNALKEKKLHLGLNELILGYETHLSPNEAKLFLHQRAYTEYQESYSFKFNLLLTLAAVSSISLLVGAIIMSPLGIGMIAVGAIGILTAAIGGYGLFKESAPIESLPPTSGADHSCNELAVTPSISH